MKALSRLASPGGFALVLLLFLFLPFLSVSCDVPGMGSIGADYTGVHLATGAEPEAEVPEELRDTAAELGELSGGGDAGGDEPADPAPDPGVRVLAIIVAVVLAAGIGTAALRRPRTRLVAAAGVAVLAAALVVITQVVARSNLLDALRQEAGDLDGGGSTAPDLDALVDDMVHTELGFWLTLVGLALITVLSVGFLLRGQIGRPAPVGAAPPPHGGPPYGQGGYPTGAQPPPGGAHPGPQGS